MQKHVIKRTLTMIVTSVLCLVSLLQVDIVSAEKKELDLKGVYHAALGIQTCTKVWIIRFAYFDKEANVYYGTEDANTMFAGDPSGDGASYTGTFEDVEIKGNGTYTVKLTGADFSGETDISQLHVATDIPLNDQIKFTDVSFSVNGREIAVFDEGYMEDEEPYLGGGMDLLLINHWREGLVNQLSSKGVPETVESGYTLLQGSGEEEVSVTFTISGFDYDNPDAVATEEPAQTDAADTSADIKKEKSNSMLPVYIGAGVIVILCAVGVIIIKRRKK